jgi:hypothetical protein
MTVSKTGEGAGSKVLDRPAGEVSSTTDEDGSVQTEVLPVMQTHELAVVEPPASDGPAVTVEAGGLRLTDEMKAWYEKQSGDRVTFMEKRRLLINALEANTERMTTQAWAELAEAGKQGDPPMFITDLAAGFGLSKKEAYRISDRVAKYNARSLDMSKDRTALPEPDDRPDLTLTPVQQQAFATLDERNQAQAREIAKLRKQVEEAEALGYTSEPDIPAELVTEEAVAPYHSLQEKELAGLTGIRQSVLGGLAIMTSKGRGGPAENAEYLHTHIPLDYYPDVGLAQVKKAVQVLQEWAKLVEADEHEARAGMPA